MKKGKKYSDSLKLIDRAKLYDPEEAVALVKHCLLYTSPCPR